MQFLPLPIALAISLFLGISGTMMAMPAASQATAQQQAQDRCNAYVVLHASLTTLQSTERFMQDMQSCIEALSAN